jgi:hypothetical protein
MHLSGQLENRAAAHELFTKQPLWQAALANHRGKRIWPNFIAESAMRSNVHEPNFSTMHSAIPTMTGSIVSVEHEVMFLDDRDEFAKRTF